jgi:putative flippase GtrA
MTQTVASSISAAFRNPLAYAVVSGLTWAIDFAVFALLYKAMPFYAAMSIARVVAAIFAFPAQRYFAFGLLGRPSFREVRRYGLLWLTNLLIATFLVEGAARISGANGLVIKFAVEITVFFGNYLALKRLIFLRRL